MTKQTANTIILSSIILVNILSRNLWTYSDAIYFGGDNICWVLAGYFVYKNTALRNRILGELIMVLSAANFIDELIFIPYQFSLDKYVFPACVAIYIIYKYLKQKHVRQHKNRGNSLRD